MSRDSVIREFAAKGDTREGDIRAHGSEPPSERISVVALVDAELLPRPLDPFRRSHADI